MNRRDVLVSGLSVFGLSMLPRVARAGLVCAEDPTSRLTTCAIGVRSDTMDGVYATQQNTQWCWAACLHMLFRYYGFEVSQARIVQEGWGNVVNLPAFHEQVIAATNRAWVSDDGRSFRAFGQFFGVTLKEVSEDLTKGAPLIVGTEGHAMLLTKLVFTVDAYRREQIQSASVRDPWPGRGARDLTPQEWADVAMLMRVSIFDANGVQVTRAPTNCTPQTTPCTHPSHTMGDVVPCQHVCQGPSGPVACHAGDLVPCQHVCQGPAGPTACHANGDYAPCQHPMHPQGDPVFVCR